MREKNVLADRVRLAAHDNRSAAMSRSDGACQHRRLAGETNRYSICERDTDVFEVYDDRRLLESLLQWREILPCDELTGLNDFRRLRQRLSSGPTLNEADRDMLDWLVLNASFSEGEDNAAYFEELCQAAIAFKGDDEGVGRFLLRSRLLVLTIAE